MLFLLFACADYTLTVTDPPALDYSAAVIDFMCGYTCEWQNVDTCYSELSSHWAYEEPDLIDPAQVEHCLEVMSDLRAVEECPYIPAECLPYSM